MAGLLSGGIAATVGNAFAGLFYAATLTQKSTTGGNAYDPSSGSTTSTDYACKGIVDEYSAYDFATGLVQVNDRKILILATSLSVTPKPDDLVTIRGATYRVIRVSTDPAIAVWELQGRAA